MPGRLMVLVLAVGAVGCGASSETSARLARVQEEGAELHRALDAVEERLLGNQAQVHLWQELGRRHQQVSALACENVQSHVLEMAKHLDLQQEKTRRLRNRYQMRSEAVTAAPVKARRSRSN